MPGAASPRPNPTTRGGFLVSCAAVALVLFGLYVLFVGSIGVNEALAGTASVALSALWWAHAGRRGGVRFAGWAPGLGPIATALAALPGATARVGAHLARAVAAGVPPGEVVRAREAEFPWARSEAPTDRALGLVAASLAPDSFVLRADEGDHGVLEHVLSRGEAAP